MKISAVLAALGLAPKTLPVATETIGTAKGALEAVNTLFANAGLNLETLLAAGPDSLKAHLDGLSAKDAELAAAQTDIAKLNKALETANASITTEKEQAQAFASKLSAMSAAVLPLGITATTKPEECAGVIDAHVKKAAALELAKTGHKPVAETVPTTPTAVAPTTDPKLTGRDRYAADFNRQIAARNRR